MQGQDISAFINAGSDYTNVSATPTEIMVRQGQGYDGQFYYRLANNPTDFSKTRYGVTLDHPAYRAQRAGYPVLAWLFSFGGRPHQIPMSLVLVNIFAFAGIFFFTAMITRKLEADKLLAFFPLVLFGIYMAVAKDLAEVTELFFFTGTIWFLLDKKWWWFSIFSTLMLVTRETTLVAFVPLALYLFFNEKQHRLTRFVHLAIPLLIVLTWKCLVLEFSREAESTAGSGNIGLPFAGIWNGFVANFDFSTPQKILQLSFWLAYFIWQIWFVGLVFIAAAPRFPIHTDFIKPLIIIYVSWLFFALCLSGAIYSDDWSFVRVFSLWNMTGLLIMISQNKKPGKLFVIYSTILLALTIIRLIIKL